MKVACPTCAASYDLDESRIPAAGVTIKCPKCMTTFPVTKDGAQADSGSGAPSAARGGGAVPLPGAGGSGEPSPRPSAGGQGAGAAGGAVPLPGAGPAPTSGDAPPAMDFAIDFGGGGASAAPPSAPPPPAAPAAPAGGDDGGISFDFIDAAPAPAARQKPAAPPPPPVTPRAPAPPVMKGGDAPRATAPPPPTQPRDTMTGATSAAPGPAAPSAAAPRKDDLELLDFIDEDSSKVRAAAGGEGPVRFSVRRRSGKVFGPFDAAAIVAMLHQGQLLGNEDISQDSEKWAPIDSNPTFAAAIPKSSGVGGAPAPPVASGGRAAPPVIDMSAGEIAPKGSASPQVMGRAPVVGGAPAQGKMDPARRRKLVRVIAMGVAGLVVLGGAGTAAFVFREKLAVLFRRAPPASTQELKAAATKSLFEDSFPSYRAGMEAAARALEPNQKDVEAAGLYLQAASYLKRRYSLSPGEWDQAVKLASRLEDENQREALKGRAGYLLATGKQAEARGLVDALANANPPDPEGAMLLAEVMLKDSDAKRAAQLLDKALQSPEIAKLAKAHHLRAEVALAAGQPQFGDAETELRKALEMDPEHVRSRVELGGALMAMGRVADAEKELKASLGEEAAKMLDATEEARAHRYLGVVYAGSRRAGDAEAEFDEAIKRDPESAANLGAYGAFRLKRREFDKAIELYKKAVAKEPGPAWVDGYARALLGAGRYVDATSQIRDAQSKDPNSAVMHYLMGRVSHGAGKADEAIKMYEKALQRDPAYAEPLIALGELALKGGDKEKAKARFSQAVEKAPSNPDAHTGMGEYLLAVDDAAGAKAAFARAVELDPDHAPARFGLGRALWALGDLKSARKELELSLQLVDRDPEVHYQYGTLLWKMGDLDAGAAAAARAVKSEPKDHRYRARLGAILFSKGDPQAAIDSLNVAASFNDKFAETYYYLGLAWSAKGDQGQAAEKMKLALELDSNNSDFHYQLGLIYENASQATDAALEFRKAIELKADHADAYEHLGNVLMVQNQYLDAVAAYDKSLDIDKKRFRVLVASADAEVAAGQPLKAIKDYLAAITADPSLAAHYKLGRAYDLTGKSEMAIQEYRLAVKNEQDNPMPHYYLGYAHKTRGANRSALAEFKEYLRLRPEAPDRKEIEDEIYYLGQK